LPDLVLLTVVLVGSSSVFAQQPTATFSGRVTDQNAAGIADVAIVAQGNQTGTRVALTDLQGNYSLTMGANTNIRLRAYKTGFFFNPVQRNYAFPVEDRRKVPGLPWLVQLTVLPPSDLIGPTDLTLTVSLRGQTSNSVHLRIRY
jgi:hypothetical protein